MRMDLCVRYRRWSRVELAHNPSPANIVQQQFYCINRQQPDISSLRLATELHMRRSQRLNTLASSRLLDLLVLTLNVFLRPSSTRRIGIFRHNEGWVRSIVIIDVFQTPVCCELLSFGSKSGGLV